MSVTLALSSAFILATTALAQDFSFDLTGNGDINWQLEFTETANLTDTQDANFTFNGGAGTDGSATAEGALAVTYGYSVQIAGGDGFALTDTNGGPYATANYAAASYGESGALAADFALDDVSNVTFAGLVTAGGAGGAGAETSTGYELIFNQMGSGNLNYNYQGSQTTTP